ncbi:MAG: hypothetical protein WC820_01025 [Spirochaetales bacterium]|jgi:hypothetical protein
MKKTILGRLYKNLVDSLSFSSELRKMRRELNAKIDMPESIAAPPPSHPLGVNRWFKKRRVSIAESYLAAVKDLDSRHTKSRLDALRILADVSLHSKNIDFPLNTARVHMALIKGVVKNRDNKRRQLELLHDFSISSHGQHQILRRLCDELNIIELPEQGMRLSECGCGWDSHVHDSATSGRKNPTQLIIDAFIKGISELTIAYGSRANLDLMEESIEAGGILGIKVNIGLEFSMVVKDHRFHFMALLPEFPAPEAARSFFRDNEKALGEFFAGLDRNQANRIESVARLLSEFNETRLRELNEGYEDEALYRVPALTLDGLSGFIQTASINTMHLAEYLYGVCKPIFLNRLLLAKVQRAKIREEAKAKRLPKREAREVEERYASLKREYETLTPEILLKRFFSGTFTIEYHTCFTDIRDIKDALASGGCRLEILHPMEHGLDNAHQLLEECKGIVDVVEIYNTQDRTGRDIEEIIKLAQIVNDLNAESAREGKPLYIPLCGSDATGWNPQVPGMGFIYEDRIIGKFRKRYINRHLALPPLISAMTQGGGKPVSPADVETAPTIVSMGKISSWAGNPVPDESESSNSFVPPLRALRYLNRKLVNLVYIVIGFIVAQHFIGPFYAILWLGITGFRNSIADLISNRGARLSEWKLKSINFDNVAQSMFWTGFSVPILGFVKTNFDALWPFTQNGLLFNSVKFFFISGVNGLYLASHNTLRGFDKKVIRANFFRSVISWPFATIFAPLGNLVHIPSIVQAKIWSDFVAGFIEGGAKYLKVLHLQLQNLEEIIPNIAAGEGDAKYVALLDLLYLFHTEPRTRTSLKVIYDPNYRPMFVLKKIKKSNVEMFHALRRTIGSQTLELELTDFILSRYESEMAVDLVDLVADTLPETRDWIVAQSL